MSQKTVFFMTDQLGRTKCRFEIVWHAIRRPKILAKKQNFEIVIAESIIESQHVMFDDIIDTSFEQDCIKTCFNSSGVKTSIFTMKASNFESIYNQQASMHVSSIFSCTIRPTNVPAITVETYQLQKTIEYFISIMNVPELL